MKSNVPPPFVAGVVERNISALFDRWRAQEEARTRIEQAADTIAHFSGSPAFVGLHVGLLALWIVVNMGWLGIRPFDPDFVKLAVAASVEAILLATFVLISNKRTAREAERRTELMLHVSLLAEHEVTQVLKLTSAIAEKLGIEQASDPALHELKHDVNPGHVLDNIEQHRRAAE